MKVAMPFARPLVELVFDLLNLVIGEGAQIAALGKVLAQQAVRPKKGMVIFSLLPRCQAEYGSAK
jgi:hypothetical protein